MFLRRKGLKVIRGLKTTIKETKTFAELYSMDFSSSKYGI